MAAKMDVDSKAEALFDELLKDVCLELAFHVEIEDSLRLAVKYPPNNESDCVYDIFNNTTSKEIYECTCPICERTVCAIRFAPHLEKCFGMGRVSSRIASRRLASACSGKDASANKMTDDASDSLSSQNDAEWTMPRPNRRTDRKRRERPKRSRARSRAKKTGGESRVNDITAITTTATVATGVAANVVTNNTAISTTAVATNTNTVTVTTTNTTNTNTTITTATDGSSTYANMSMEQKQSMFQHMCGVISEHTGRLCTRSVRCPKHTNVQRSNVRMTLLLTGEDANQNDQRDTLVGNMVDVQTKNKNQSSGSSCNTTPVKRSERHYRGKCN